MIERDHKHPTSIAIAVPRQYRECLTRKHNRRLLLVFGIYVGLLCIFYLLKWTAAGYSSDGVFFVIGVFEWIRRTRQRTWRYIIDERHLHLIQWEYGTETAWHWLDVEWKRESVVGVARSEWRGLPALQITLERKHANCLVMVYTIEDEEKVTVHVLPLIEKYRQKYRQKIWADSLKS